MNNVLLRSLTGGLFVALMIGSIYFDSRVAAAVFGVFFIVGLNEFFSIIRINTIYHPNYQLSLIVGITSYTLAFLILEGLINSHFIFTVFGLSMTLLISVLFDKSSTPFENTSISFFGLCYVMIPFLMMMHLNYQIDNKWDLIGMFVLIWSNDTFAYVSGRMFGRTKLFERISPKKTWEGTIGGLIMVFIVAILWSYYLSSLTLSFWLIVAPLIAVGAIFGDLFESLIKRQIGIKDTGNILPGHGGILDRFDAALMAIPFFYSVWAIYN